MRERERERGERDIEGERDSIDYSSSKIRHIDRMKRKCKHNLSEIKKGKDRGRVKTQQV